jgi:hypothetical protein
MTEKEYVTELRDLAERYLEFIRKPDLGNAKSAAHWQVVKEKLSAHTMIRLCDHWLNNPPSSSDSEQGDE